MITVKAVTKIKNLSQLECSAKKSKSKKEKTKKNNKWKLANKNKKKQILK